MDRSARREEVFKLLYSIEIQKEILEDTIDLFIEANHIEDQQTKDYMKEVIMEIKQNQKEIDEKISQKLKQDWEIERISKINISLLRLAIFEIEYKQIPFKVVINEVVELAKKYGEDQSPAFVNGILANIVKEN